MPLRSQVAFAQYGEQYTPQYTQPRDHGFEITGLAGYQVATPTFEGSTTAGINTVIKMASSPSYGVVLSRLVRPGIRSELSWRYEPTHLTVSPLGGMTSQTDLAVHYFTAGGTYERGTERVKGFAMLGIGAMLAHPDTPSVYGDEWFFSFAFALGMKLWINEHLGIRLESRLQVPVRFSEGGMWCINGSCLVALSGGRAIAQVDFVGGPVLAF
jgi:hypothetical protein